MQKINLEELQQAVNSRSLKELDSETPKGSRREELKKERLMDRLWERLQEMYGHQLNSQYGETIPESWELLLRDLAPLQIKGGLEALVGRNETWPPNAIEFRQLCLPTTISPDGNNTAAYLMIDDPKHPRNDPSSPEYVKPVLGIESDSYKTKRRRAGNTALKDMLGKL
jgi:hypothetical protein